MTKIRLYEELVSIKLKDWRVITTEATLKQVADLLNNNEFITIGDVWFSKYEVRTFETFNPTEIDCFVYSQPKSVRAELEKIIEARKEKGFKINWTEHLREIYQNYIKKDWTQ